MTLFILFAAFGPGPEVARPVQLMSYATMLKTSDLAIIGVFVSERADNEPIDEPLKGDEARYEGISTKLKLVAVLKGDAKGEVVVRHHRVRADFHGQIINGPSFAEFKPGIDYLVFLKKRPDGRFECVTGQLDPEYSVKRIEPRWSMVDDIEQKKVSRPMGPR